MDARDLQRLAVRPQAVAIDGKEKGRPVGYDPIQIRLVRPCWREHIHTPAEAAQDP
jgi:hypothetical protein